MPTEILEIKNLFYSDASFFAYFDSTSAPSSLKAVNELDAYIAAEGPYDGVIAFSQPAALVTTLMIRKLKEDPEGHRADPLFKCAIFFSPAIMPVDYEALQVGEVRKLSFTADGEIIDIPTAHIWGCNDQWAATGNELSRMCKARVRSVFIHDGGHEMPGPGSKVAVTHTVNVIQRAIDTALFGY
jgi:Serine hydrolase (FSH1)